jgi:hypothetical protein
MLSSRAFKTLLSALARVPRDAGAFVAINHTMAERLLAFRVSRPFLVSLIGLTGLPATSIPIARSPRPRGRSAYSGAARLKAGLSALCWTLWWRLNPASLHNGEGPESAPIKAKLGARFLATEAEGE